MQCGLGKSAPAVSHGPHLKGKTSMLLGEEPGVWPCLSAGSRCVRILCHGAVGRFLIPKCCQGAGLMIPLDELRRQKQLEVRLYPPGLRRKRRSSPKNNVDTPLIR